MPLAGFILKKLQKVPKNQVLARFLKNLNKTNKILLDLH